jgi:hypothetical protein
MALLTRDLQQFRQVSTGAPVLRNGVSGRAMCGSAHQP